MVGISSLVPKHSLIPQLVMVMSGRGYHPRKEGLNHFLSNKCRICAIADPARLLLLIRWDSIHPPVSIIERGDIFLLDDTQQLLTYPSLANLF